MNWLVALIDEHAFDRWAAPFPRKIAMRAWLDGLEVTGPPAVTGTSVNGLDTTDGPNGEVVEFTVLAKPLDWGAGPPYALIGIYSIENR